MDKFITIFIGILFMLGFAFLLNALQQERFFQQEKFLVRGTEPQLSGDSIINGSSTLAGYGAVIFTNASNTGDWFRIVNPGSAGGVFCGALSSATTTDGVTNSRGQFLTPVSSSTGSNAWEMRGVRGNIGCVPQSSGTAIFWSFSGR